MKISMRQLRQLIKEQLEETPQADNALVDAIKTVLDEVDNDPKLAKDAVLVALNTAMRAAGVTNKVDLGNPLRAGAPTIEPPIGESRRRSRR